MQLHQRVRAALIPQERNKRWCNDESCTIVARRGALSEYCSNEALLLLGTAEHLDSDMLSISVASNTTLIQKLYTILLRAGDFPQLDRLVAGGLCPGGRRSCSAQPAHSLYTIVMSALNPATKTVRYEKGPGIGKKKRTDMERSLYRRSLKLALDWAVQRNLWRGQAVYIRSLFDANKNIRDPRQQRVQEMLWYHKLNMTLTFARKVLFTETEKLLQKWKHPDPYVPPTAPGGSKFERNLPAPDLPREYDLLTPKEHYIDLLDSTAKGTSTKFMIDSMDLRTQSLYILRKNLKF